MKVKHTETLTTNYFLEECELIMFLGTARSLLDPVVGDTFSMYKEGNEYRINVTRTNVEEYEA